MGLDSLETSQGTAEVKCWGRKPMKEDRGVHGPVPQQTRAPCTEDETYSPLVGAVAGLPICQNTLCFRDPAPKEGHVGRAHFRAWLPSLFPAVDCAWMSLTGGGWWAENTPLGYPSPLLGSTRGDASGTARVSSACWPMWRWLKAVSQGGFRLCALPCVGVEVRQHWVLGLLPLL